MVHVWNRYRKAQLALQKGEEDLAREALKRRKSFAVSLISYINLLCFAYFLSYFFILRNVCHSTVLPS